MPELVHYDKGLIVLDLLPGTEAAPFAHDIVASLPTGAGCVLTGSSNCRNDFNLITSGEMDLLQFFAGSAATDVVCDFNCPMTRLSMIGAPLQRYLTQVDSWQRGDKAVWLPREVEELLEDGPSFDVLTQRFLDAGVGHYFRFSPSTHPARLSTTFVVELMEESLFLYSKRYQELNFQKLSPVRPSLDKERSLEGVSSEIVEAVNKLLASEFEVYGQYRRDFERETLDLIKDETYIAFKVASTAANDKFRDAYLRGDYRYLPEALRDAKHPSGFHERLADLLAEM